MWSSKADANYYTNSIIVAFSCSRRFTALHNSINHSKSLEFLKYREEISAAAPAEPEEIRWIRWQGGTWAESPLQPPSVGCFAPWAIELWRYQPKGWTSNVFHSAQLAGPPPSNPASGSKHRLRVGSLTGWTGNQSESSWSWSREGPPSPIGASIRTSHPGARNRTSRHCSTSTIEVCPVRATNVFPKSLDNSLDEEEGNVQLID